MIEVDTLILGAGLAGLSSSYHIGHKKCLILEAKVQPYGHIHSEFIDEFTWDEGPHVSFTKSEYVRELFASSVEDQFEEYEVRTGNYYKDRWIDHPAQSNLYQLPESLRSQCLESFLATRDLYENAPLPKNYREWLRQAFGPVFADAFPAAYTRKYWTMDPVDLTTEWVGGRVFKPSIDDVVNGSKGPLDRQTHYIKKVRYPSRGGYQAFASKLIKGANIKLSARVVSVDLVRKTVATEDGSVYAYKRLINTMPLPTFVECCQGVSGAVRDAAKELLCSSIQLVNVTAPHETLRPENWMYVYDEDKYSVRINCTEKLSPNNAPTGHTGVQVEVYHSRCRPLEGSYEEVEVAVIDELIEMGLICPERAGGLENVQAFSRMVPWANIIFHHETKAALNVVLSWLSGRGLVREMDDLHPMTDWSQSPKTGAGDLVLAGRFGQWKYFWSDDCLMRGASIV